MVTTQIGNVFAQRTERRSIFEIGLFSNRFIWVGIATELVVISVIVYVQVFQQIFGTATFPAEYWLFPLSNRPIGCSTAFVKSRGLIRRMINREVTDKKEYYKEIIPQVDWAFMIIPGVVIGAFLASILSGQFHIF